MIEKLICNGKVNPIDIDAHNVKLSAYISNIKKIKEVVFNVFDEQNVIFSLKTKSLFCYIKNGVLDYQKKYFWTVTVKTDKNVEISEKAFFETTIKTFKAKWICNPQFDGHVSEFKYVFSLNGEIKSAKLFIVGLGMYQSFINGEKTDEYYYKPLLTDFDKRQNLNNADYDEINFDNNKKTVCYNVFDVKKLLKSGENELKVLVGTGWYYDTDKNVTDPAFYFDKPKLIFELHVYDSDGEKIFYSDKNVSCRNLTRISQMFNGDFDDFTKEQTSFSFSDFAKQPNSTLVPNKFENDSVVEKINGKKIDKFGKLVYDFGKNHSGSLSLKVKGRRGSKLIINYYESADENGLNSKSSDCILFDENVEIVKTIHQQDSYILSGNVDVVEPLFHFNCYRFVSFECDENFDLIDVKSLFICGNLDKDSIFYCSDNFIQKFYNAYKLTQLDNIHCGVPSDCPHREKLPYTGDGSLTTESVLYSFNAEYFYSKWLDDIIASQGNDGWIPFSAPNLGGSGGYFWSNVITVVPLRLFEMTGDKYYLEKSINAVAKYLEYCKNILDKDSNLIKRLNVQLILGEWLNPTSTKIDVSFVNTVAYYVALKNATKICTVLKEESLIKEYKKQAKIIKKSINDNFFNEKNMQYCDGEQGASVYPILLEIVENKFKKRTIENLIKYYKENTFFDTGIVLTPALLELLIKLNQPLLAYSIFTNKEKPSFYKMLENEMTLCEHWNKKWPDKLYDLKGNLVKEFEEVSHCHPMFGSVVSWVYKFVSGLDLSDFYKGIVRFSPKFIKQIKSAKADKKTLYGLVSIEYENYDKFKAKIEIPVSLKGYFVLDEKEVGVLFVDGKKKTSKNGKYIIRLKSGIHNIIEI